MRQTDKDLRRIVDRAVRGPYGQRVATYIGCLLGIAGSTLNIWLNGATDRALRSQLYGLVITIVWGTVDAFLRWPSARRQAEKEEEQQSGPP